MDWRQRQQLAIRAVREAERARLFANIPHTAPIDPIETSIKYGCQVRFMSLASLDGMYSPEPGPVIFLGSERPAGRRAYTCAHELAHHVFKHGMCMDELNAQKISSSEKPPEEYLADLFAGHMLMSKPVICHSLRERGLTASSLLPVQVFGLANYFGVGYGTVVNHLAYSLQMITRPSAEALLKVQPKQIKAQYGANADSEVVLVDYHWLHRAVDLEVGDTLVLPKNAEVEAAMKLQVIGERDNSSIYRAAAVGYTRAFSQEHNWAVNIRISWKNYTGLAQYRFLEDVGEE